MNEELTMNDILQLILKAGNGKITFSIGDIIMLCMISGKCKLAMFAFYDNMKDLIELSKGKPVPFSEVKYEEPSEHDNSDDEQSEIWYDDSKLRSCDLRDSLRRYPIVAATQLDELHHDIISYWDSEWDTDDPMYGLTINIVFDDSEDAKEYGDEWYIEVYANDDEDRQFHLYIKDGGYQFT